ncbi:hypothetical protein FB451DRAFT_1194264 [Mycena latifolia]|nr:hypothetical protein FB451DRAFT_1194264 [Mycena latifolia]
MFLASNPRELNRVRAKLVTSLLRLNSCAKIYKVVRMLRRPLISDGAEDQALLRGVEAGSPTRAVAQPLRRDGVSGRNAVRCDAQKLLLQARHRRLEVLEFSVISSRIFDTFEDAPRLNTVRFRDGRDGHTIWLPGRQMTTMELGDDVTDSTIALPRSTPTSNCQKPDIARRLPCAVSTLPTPSLPTVSDFIRRSRCDLTELVIYNCCLRAIDTLELVSLVPNLNILAIEYALPNALIDKVMHALALNPDQPSHLPSLTTLRIDGSYLFQEHSLITMLESRTSDILCVLAARLDAAVIVLRDRAIAAHTIECFAALRPLHLSVFCLDDRKDVRTVMGSRRPPVYRDIGSAFSVP